MWVSGCQLLAEQLPPGLVLLRLAPWPCLAVSGRCCLLLSALLCCCRRCLMPAPLLLLLLLLLPALWPEGCRLAQALQTDSVLLRSLRQHTLWVQAGVRQGECGSMSDAEEAGMCDVSTHTQEQSAIRSGCSPGSVLFLLLAIRRAHATRTRTTPPPMHTKRLMVNSFFCVSCSFTRA